METEIWISYNFHVSQNTIPLLIFNNYKKHKTILLYIALELCKNRQWARLASHTSWYSRPPLPPPPRKGEDQAQRASLLWKYEWARGLGSVGARSGLGTKEGGQREPWWDSKIEQWLFILYKYTTFYIYLCSYIYQCFLFLHMTLTYCLCLFISVRRIPFSISCRTVLLPMNSLSFPLSRNVL